MQVKKNKLIKGVSDNEHAISKKKQNIENNSRVGYMEPQKEITNLITVVLV